MFIKHKHWLQEKLCCTRCLKYNWISHISKPVRKMESENATSYRNMETSGRWLYSANQHTYIYSQPPLIIQFCFFYSLGCRRELISDLISHVGRPADPKKKKKQSWEKRGPSVPFLHTYGSVITWIIIYSSCNPALEFTSLLLNPAVWFRRAACLTLRVIAFDVALFSQPWLLNKHIGRPLHPNDTVQPRQAFWLDASATSVIVCILSWKWTLHCVFFLHCPKKKQ